MQFELSQRLREAVLPEEDCAAAMATVQQEPFFKLPQYHADQYGSVREASSIGRIFTLANAWHDQIDAAVVIGRHETLEGMRAVIEARCDPFHNELDRAGRGSKPRMYFATTTSDNDSLAAITDRITKPTAAWGPQRFAVVAVIEGAESQEVIAMLKWFTERLAHLEKSTSETIQPFVAIIKSELVTLPASVTTMADHHFDIPAGIEGLYATFTPAGLLPMAMLGLNCIKLLEGGLDMAKQLASKLGEDNLACRMRSVQRWARQNDRTPITLSHQDSLARLATWCDSLWWSRRGSIAPTLVVPRDARQAATLVRADGFVQRVKANADRQDSVCLPMEPSSNSSGSVHERKVGQLRSLDSTLQAASRYSTDLTLPSIDMFPMGQWMQLAMTASAMDFGDSETGG
ncbi:hypothetical protein [Rubripirellula amarantea]|uniref:hypothetical protein n=1 Tax=Rubripirellula amarantea TaxID=2527999 RepID=UPI0011B4911F|nr:hypothetical protein [Rubripirellula amarantea]